MKKLSFLFVALALVGFISLNSCKTAGTAEEAADDAAAAIEAAVDQAVEEAVDSIAVEEVME